jgi:DNA-binding NtrC family response regulator
MRLLADSVSGREEPIVRRWAEHYDCAFPESGYFTTDSFPKSARAEIRDTLAHLRSGDADGLAAFFRRQGRACAAMGIPLSEACRSVRLLEESIVETIREEGCASAELLALHSALGQLSFERLVLLVESYRAIAASPGADRESADRELPARPARMEAGRDRFCGMVGRTACMQRVYESLALAARSRDAVLVVGESGTGKELAARAIHALSGDPARTFVAVNCAALAHELIESELFGHRRGAFSGADTDHAGLFQAAHGGTLFLDEMTELIPAAQAKLLRALQERAVRPVGGISEIPVAVRIVASTNQALDESLEAGVLRRDLYYRIQHLVIPLPPLRERVEDIPLLVDHFIEKANTERLGVPKRGISRAALDRLAARDWPGNVRELENTVRLACKRSASRRLDVDDFAGLPPAGTGPRFADPMAERPESLRAAEREAIARALRLTEGNKSRAARLLGISRKQLYVKLRNYGLSG